MLLLLFTPTNGEPVPEPEPEDTTVYVHSVGRRVKTGTRSRTVVSRRR